MSKEDALRTLPSLGWFLIVGIITMMWRNLRCKSAILYWSHYSNQEKVALMAISVIVALVGRILLTPRSDYTAGKGLFFGAWTLIGMGDITQIRKLYRCQLAAYEVSRIVRTITNTPRSSLVTLHGEYFRTRSKSVYPVHPIHRLHSWSRCQPESLQGQNRESCRTSAVYPDCR